MMAQMSYDQQDLLDQLPHLDFSQYNSFFSPSPSFLSFFLKFSSQLILSFSFHNVFKSGFNASINAMEEKALRNASLYFPQEDVKLLGEMGGLVARMFYKASDERGICNKREKKENEGA
jgi:hypothetical protein